MVTRFRVVEGTLLIDLLKPCRILSSAPRQGGFGRARYVLNHQVLPNPVAAPLAVKPAWRCENPSPYLGRSAAGMGAKGASVALMTAVPMERLVTVHEEAAGLWVEGFVTVGVTNAMRAGQKRSPRERIRPSNRAAGTINIILVTNARLAAGGMVEAVQVITEAKTGTLLSHNVPTSFGMPGATGTGTDAVVVISGAGRSGPSLRYCGTHTRMGELIGSLVARSVAEGLGRATAWPRANSAISKEI